MSYRDYIPLATTPTAGRSRFDHDDNDDDGPFGSGGGPVRPTGHSSSGQRRYRRQAIFGTGLVISLIALYFIFSDLLDDAEDLFLDDPDFIPGYHAAYLPFEPPDEAADPTTRLTPTQALPDHCRDAYFSTGALCFDPDIPPMDVIWTWVNGSDPLLQAAKLDAESHFAPDDPYRPKESASAARQYRCAFPCPVTRRSHTRLTHIPLYVFL